MKNIKSSKSFFNILEKSIIEVISLDNMIKYEKDIKVIEYKNKYSNMDTPSISISYMDNPLSTRKFKVKY